MLKVTVTNNNKLILKHYFSSLPSPYWSAADYYINKPLDVNYKDAEELSFTSRHY